MDSDTRTEAEKIQSWNDYMKQKEMEEAKLAQTSQGFESPDQLRLKFAAEITLIEDLYRPVLKIAEANLPKNEIRTAEKLYADWGGISSKEFLTSYYVDPKFLAIYTKKRFHLSCISFLQALIARILPKEPDMENFLATQVTRVISIGCGSGPDIAAFLAYAKSRNIEKRFVYYAIDQSDKWNPYITALEKETVVRHKTSIWFKSAQFGMDLSDVDALPDADMIVSSFSNTAKYNPKIWPLMQKRFKFILVLDGKKDTVQTSYDKADFVNMPLDSKTTVYYYFQKPETDPSAKQ